MAVADVMVNMSLFHVPSGPLLEREVTGRPGAGGERADAVVTVGGMDLTFSGDIWYWRGPAPWYFVTVPREQCVALRSWSFASYGWGMIPVTAQIGDSEWETSLWPKDGRYVVPVKAHVRRAEDLDEGVTVAVRLAIRVQPGLREGAPSADLRRDDSAGEAT